VYATVTTECKFENLHTVA